MVRQPGFFDVEERLRELSAKASAVDPMELAREIEKLLLRFPNARVNPDEQRQLRAALYRPLLPVAKEHRARLVELTMELILQ